MHTIKIAAVGDIAIMRRPEKSLFKFADDSFDLYLANLEGPILSSPGIPADKPVRIRLPKGSAAWLKEIGVSAVSLANNHILDWGMEGLYETLYELDKAGISHAGAGKNAEEAAAAIILDVGGRKIAFLSWAATVPNGFKALQNRPGIAGIKVKTSFIVDGDIDEQPGTPPWVCTEAMEDDLRAMEDSIRSAAGRADFTILAIHWGIPPKESSVSQGPIAEYQSQIIDRAIISGAGIILGHHCHIPLGVQISHGVPVLFSLGNFIFHCDHLPGGLDVSTSPVPYTYIPGNKESCFTEIEIVSGDAGAVKLERVTMVPCMLSEYGEAIEATEEISAAIANRLLSFSTNRKAEVKIVDNNLVWESNQE